ncbi:DMT family transporter [Dongia sp.]|uniref:DMT family transporter n=1 Tax=Dongia sp. TaxID=1977262 RepID=UPI003753E02E
MSSEAASSARAGGSRLMAALSLCVGIAIFSSQDWILKYVSGTYPLSEAIAIRTIAALPFLLIMVHRGGGLARLVSRRFYRHVIRGLIMLSAYSTYYLALPAMDLAEAVTLYFTGPLFITVLAIPMLGERLQAKRVVVLLVGFLGVIVTCRPGAGVFDLASLLPVFAAFTYGVAQLMARQIGGSESAAVMGFYQNIMYMIGAIVLAALFGHGAFAYEGMHPSLGFLLRPWSFERPFDLFLLACCGPIAAAGTVLLSHAYRIAEANYVAPFEYTALIWAASWGFLIFNEVPTVYTYIGAALIVGAGLYMLFSGRRAAG